MNCKVTYVPLVCKANGLEREFEISHAERILSLPNCGGWELVTDEYEYADGTITRRHPEVCNGTKKQKCDKQSNSTSK